MTPDELLAGQVRTLLITADTLTTQIAEMVVQNHIERDAMAVREAKMLALEVAFTKNSQTVSEVIKMLEPLTGLFKFIGWIGTVIKWAGAVAAACLAIYSLWYTASHNGDLPQLPKTK